MAEEEEGVFTAALRMLSTNDTGSTNRSVPGGVVRQQGRDATAKPAVSTPAAATTAADGGAKSSSPVRSGAISASGRPESGETEGFTSPNSAAAAATPSKGGASESGAAATAGGGAGGATPGPADSNRSARSADALSPATAAASGGAISSARGGAGTPSGTATATASAGSSIRGSQRSDGTPWPDEASLPPSRLVKFSKALDTRNVDVEGLRSLAWNGVPSRYRTAVWQMLLGYLPLSRDRQVDSVIKKRAEYASFVQQSFGGARVGGVSKSDGDGSLLRQVLVDVPRTCPDHALFRAEWLQRSLERVLYVYAQRHFATGYVQGINDLAAPLYVVFLSCYGLGEDSKPAQLAAAVDAALLPDIEADVYGCLCRLLEGIQDHYTPTQPGIQKMMFRMRELVHRIDESLVSHLEKHGVEFHTFAFRWMNCLLTRELPLRLILRLWDTYLAESRNSPRDGFDTFQVYVCAALLLKFAPRLKELPFTELVTFLQKLPTADWSVTDVDQLLSQAYVYKTLFEAAPSHLS